MRIQLFSPILGLATIVACAAASEDVAASADLRQELHRFHLQPRQQGPRPTCSVFAVTQALEFAVAKQQPDHGRLSPEYLVWAANQVRPDARDGGFFSELWDGFAKHGIATETSMPYAHAFDPHRLPEDTAKQDAAKLLSLGLHDHWIKKWDVKTGLTDPEFASILSTLQSGSPVCGGFRWPKSDAWKDGVVRMCGPEDVFDGHSVLLIGYKEDPSQPGGGLLLIRDSATGEDRHMPFGYAKEFMNDAVWFGKFDKMTSPSPSTAH